MSHFTEERILKHVRTILSDYLGVADDPNEIKPEHSLTEDLGADSLDLVEIVMSLEEEFEIDIDDDEAVRVKTVADTVAMVRRLLGDRAAA